MEKTLSGRFYGKMARLAGGEVLGLRSKKTRGGQGRRRKGIRGLICRGRHEFRVREVFSLSLRPKGDPHKQKGRENERG